MRKKYILPTIITTIILLMFFLYYPLVWYFQSIQVLDEVVFVYCFLVLIYGMILKKIVGKERKIIINSIVLITIIIIIGLISNFRSELIILKSAILIDIVGMMKAPVIFYFFLFRVRKEVKEDVIKILTPLAKIYVLVALVFGVVNIFFDFGMSFDVRYGMRSFQFFYTNPAALFERLLMCLVLITAGKTRHKKIFVFMLFFIGLLTLRGNAFGTIGVGIIAYMILNNDKTSILKLLPMGLMALLLGYAQINEYFLENESPRSLLLKGGITLANENLPIGTGFATYGSDQAFKHYSINYYRFGFDKVWALSSVGGITANDNFWPMLLGQFGYIGLICYMCLILIQFQFFLSLNIDKNRKTVILILLGFLLISSMGNAIYTSISSVGLYVFLSLLYCSEMNDY